MKSFNIEENSEGQENFVGFEDGRVTTWSGASFSGYGHKFSESSTRKLYKVMKKYYESK
jgi:hypothetical protein